MHINLFVVGVLGLYVLSAGPADVLLREGYISQETWGTLYIPLIKACGNDRTAWTLLFDYYDWWGELFPIRPFKWVH